jgi:hypothetical protein
VTRIDAKVYPWKFSKPPASPAITPKERRMAIAPTWAMTR